MPCRRHAAAALTRLLLRYAARLLMFFRCFVAAVDEVTRYAAAMPLLRCCYMLYCCAMPATLPRFVALPLFDASHAALR